MNPVRLILDASAVAAYPSVAVGELIGEIHDEGGTFGVPAAALVSAASNGVDNVRLLTQHEAFVALDLTGDNWQQVAVTLGLVGGSIGAAHAVIATEMFDCDILTAEPDVYASLGDDPPVIPID